ncbi:MAG: hypothetical protein ABL985_02060 [Casimicrobium sp.]
MSLARPLDERCNVCIEALYPEVDSIDDPQLKAAVAAVWGDLWARSRWANPADVPTSSEISYPNLPHTRSVLQISLAMADAFSTHHGIQVNRDHLIAAAVLQDASKVIEYEPAPGGGAAKTEIGKTYPHAFWCAHLGVLHGLPADVCDAILTHSPSAARLPRTLEGKILFFADQIDIIAIHGDQWTKHLFLSK